MRCLLVWCGCLALIISSGCAICCSSQDANYAAYGGRRQRTDMVHGRVASAYDPAPEVIQAAADRQSPQLAEPRTLDGDEVPDAGTYVPDEDFVPEGAFPGEPLEGDAEQSLPQLPEGTIELPELESDSMPPFDGSTAPGTLPPDLPGNGDRSAQRHPLQEILADEL